jgi:REP element-mobilizing transposase RayT
LTDEFVVMPNHIHFIVFIISDDDFRDNVMQNENNCRDVAMQHLYGNGKNENFCRKNSREYFSKISPKK